MPKLSVIIPTYKRPEDLKRALESLQGQTFRECEAIVVDNANDSKVREVVEEFKAKFPFPLLYVPEPKIGLHYARHAGARVASSDLLVFTDDDATFSPEWLEAYQNAFSEHKEMAVAGGPVKPIWEVPPPRWLTDYVNLHLKTQGHFGIFSLMEPFESFALSRYRTFFWGTNMAIRRDVLFEAGGFHPESVGKIWIGDGESGLERKLRERKVLIGYVPEALVYHHIPRERMTAAYMCRRVANQGGCTEYAYFHEVGFSKMRAWLRMLKICAAWARDIAKAPLRAYVRKNRFAWLEMRMQNAYHLFRLRYLLWLLRDPQFRELVEKRDWL